MATTPAPTKPAYTALRSARGGISGGAILTGVVVAFGAMSLLSALIAGLVVALGLPGSDTPFPGTEVDGGLVTGVILVLAQFGSYLWGGYTAGRMARGAGVANGLLVPLVGFLLVILIVAIVSALGTSSTLSSPFEGYSVQIENEAVVKWGAGIGIAMIVTMFVGGGLGGALGMRWHTRLERDASTERVRTEQPPTDPDGTTVTNLP